MRMKLNGWQRLWIALCVIYLVPVLGLAFLFWPTAEAMGHRDEFIAQMPADVRAHVDRAYASEWSWEEARKKRVTPSDEATEKMSKGKKASPPRGVFLDSVALSFPNGAILDVQVAKEGDTEPDARVAR